MAAAAAQQKRRLKRLVQPSNAASSTSPARPKSRHPPLRAPNHRYFPVDFNMCDFSMCRFYRLTTTAREPQLDRDYGFSMQGFYRRGATEPGLHQSYFFSMVHYYQRDEPALCQTYARVAPGSSEEKFFGTSPDGDGLLSPEEKGMGDESERGDEEEI